MPTTGTAQGLQASQIGIAIALEVNATDGFLLPLQPNIVDFWAFLTNSVQIPASALPPTSPYPQYALSQALQLVLPSPGGGILYTLAVYNCAAHLVFAITPDQTSSNYFREARSNTGFSLIQPSTGLVVNSSDNGTSAGLAEPKWASRLTVSQLDFFRTPWGRYYLNYNQAYGPNIVAVS